jgi:polar amino acid transport system substrate-binding protein
MTLSKTHTTHTKRESVNVRIALITFALMCLSGLAQAEDSLQLGNDPWPPFVIKGEEQGIAEELVCEALTRAGWSCSVAVDDWQSVLSKANAGFLDGIAGAWPTSEREVYLLFSRAYLTNRIVPVMRANDPARINSIADLTGRRVALASGYAYGEEITRARLTFQSVRVSGDAAAFNALESRRADVALVDELIAREFVNSPEGAEYAIGDAVLVFRTLHFAMSRQHPDAEAIVTAFNHSFEQMLQDGSINRILNIDWLATDLGQDGELDLVLRSGADIDTLAVPGGSGSTYALGQTEYKMMKQSGFDYGEANYRVDGVEHESMDSAISDTYSKKKVCGYDQWRAAIVCNPKKMN